MKRFSLQQLQALCGMVNDSFPHAHVVIAGGALRDTLHEKPVKDLDVFIRLDIDSDDERLYQEWYDGCTKLACKLGNGYSDITTWVGSNNWPPRPIEGSGSLDPDLKGSRNNKGYSYGAFSLVDFTPGYYNTPVQLVFIAEDPVKNVRDHFDFGLSQVYCTRNTLRMFPPYWKDKDLKRITYTPSVEPNDQRIMSSMLRLRRLQEKYAGWSFQRAGYLESLARKIIEDFDNRYNLSKARVKSKDDEVPREIIEQVRAVL